MNTKLFNISKKDTEYQSIINDLTINSTVKQMSNFIQHCNTNCYLHCYYTSYLCYKVCKRLKLDYKSAARAAMLHDLFLYDWRIKNNRKGFHAFTHPKLAYKNASQLFNLTSKEKDIIEKHMWPVTPIPPKYIEGFILTIIDKYCTIHEFFEYFIVKILKPKISKFAYIFLGIILFK